ncbi:hypothetical protein [Dermatophilus congolensis]|nr:hypothetical protein [Dermatophilus congolensis]MBO3134386.1 hypothetical protein [Dermatophilus congolensis]MBO3136621.1 hypothetical protein [Dermatophilus congolensis]MBO3138865.1 hypothetical protein [Dermatophilus congolensis]MBO3144860.1 hypothetical protein [Dermatophilus congolensis]MBO3147806.1 hypothetical protein [Dermatophilus congolensis]
MDEDIFGAPIAVEDELRPPESWPGAAGQKSVAPDVPTWPSGPIHLAPEGNKTRQRRQAKKAPNPTPGGSWPGAEPSTVDKPSAAQPQPETRRSRKQVTKRSNDLRGRAALSWAFLLLLAGAALVAWVVLDDRARILQLVGSLLLLITAAVVGLIALRRR